MPPKPTGPARSEEINPIDVSFIKNLKFPSWASLLLKLAGIVALVFILINIIFSLWVNPNAYKETFRQALSQATQREVEIGDVKLKTWGSAALTANNLLLVRQPAYGKRELVDLAAREAEAEVDFFSLLFGRLVIKRFVLDQVVINVQRDIAGNWSFSDLLDKPIETPQVALDLERIGLAMHHAEINVIDQGISPGRAFRMTNMDVDLTALAGEKLPISLQGNLTEDRKTAFVTMEGSVTPPKIPTGGLNGWGGNLQVKVQDFQPQLFQIYFQPIESLRGLYGKIKADFQVRGVVGQDYQLQGKSTIENMDWYWPQTFGSLPWSSKNLTTDFKVEVTPKAVRFDNIKLAAEGALVEMYGSVTPPDKSATPPGTTGVLDLSVKTRNLDPFIAREHMPAGVLGKNLYPWLYQSSGQGTIEGDLQLKGYLAADKGKVDSPYIPISTTGRLDVRGLDYKGPGFARPLEKIEGPLVFKPEGGIQSDGMRMQVGTSEVLIAGTTGPQLALTVKAPDLDLDAGRSLLLNKRLGALALPMTLSKATGKGNMDLKIEGSLENPALTGVLAIQNVDIQDTRLPKLVRNVTGTVNFTPALTSFSNVQGRVDDAPFSVSGQFRGTSRQLDIKSDSLDLALGRALLASDLFASNIRQGVSNNLLSLTGKAKAVIRIENQTLTGQIALKPGAKAAFSWLASPLSDLQGTLSFSGDGVKFQNITGQVVGGGFQFDGLLASNALSGDLRGRAAFPQIQTLFPARYQELLQGDGSAPYSARIERRGSQTLITGAMDLSQVGNLGWGRALALNGSRALDVDLTVNGDQLLIERADLSTPGTRISMTGRVSQVGRSPNLDLRLATAPLDLDQLYRLIPAAADLTAVGGQNALNITLTGNPNKPKIKGGIVLADMQVRSPSGDLPDFSGTLPLTTEGVDFSPIAAEIQAREARARARLEAQRERERQQLLELERQRALEEPLEPIIPGLPEPSPPPQPSPAAPDAPLTNP
ncbi:MAG: DUF3971 domain-containing protein [Gloeobacterales cyanobacterium]